MPSTMSRVSRSVSSRPVSGCATLTVRGSDASRVCQVCCSDGCRARQAASCAQDCSSASKAACASGCRGLGQRHVRRRDAVQHHPPHVLRVQPQVLQRRARAVGHAHQVDALCAQRLAHGIQVGHGRRRAVVAQVAVRQRLQLAQAVARALQLPLRVELLAQRPAGRLVAAAQRRAAPGTALVDEHDVAPLAEARQQAAHRCRPGRWRSAPARRPGRTPGRASCCVPAPAARRNARRCARRCRAPHRADATPCRRKPRAPRPRCGTGSALRPVRPAPAGRAAEPRQRAQASRRRSSPLSISLTSSAAPPTSTPLTKTIGKVGQPVHIFSALRRRQSLK